MLFLFKDSHPGVRDPSNQSFSLPVEFLVTDALETPRSTLIWYLFAKFIGMGDIFFYAGQSALCSRIVDRSCSPGKLGTAMLAALMIRAPLA